MFMGFPRFLQFLGHAQFQKKRLRKTTKAQPPERRHAERPGLRGGRVVYSTHTLGCNDSIVPQKKTKKMVYYATVWNEPWLYKLYNIWIYIYGLSHNPMVFFMVIVWTKSSHDPIPHIKKHVTVNQCHKPPSPSITIFGPGVCLPLTAGVLLV